MNSNLALDVYAQAPMSVIVFDIGGTWFRRAVLTPAGELVALTRRAAINYKNTPHSTVHSLQGGLVDYIANEVHRLRAELPREELRLVGISMGAALNAHTGLILNSGPLWGPACEPFDLLAALRKREPGIEWTIVNDITAALLRYARLYERDSLSKLLLVTVSTGIGCRVYDARSQTVPVDRLYGLQGEIGHLPIAFEYKGRPIELQCDCGGLNHMNAFCSGRGIEALIRVLATLYAQDSQASLLLDAVQGVPEHLRFEHFAKAVADDDAFARDILDSVTLPLARMLLNLFTLDPEVERVILAGGAVHTLGEKYLNSLLSHLDAIGLYQISQRDPSFFRRQIWLGLPDDNAGLFGAAIAAKSHTIPFPRNWEVATDGCSVRYSAKAGTDQWSVQAQLPVHYTVVESDGLFTLDNQDLLSSQEAHRGERLRRFVIIDKRVDGLHGDRIRRYFRHHGVEGHILALDTSERGKNIEAVLRSMEELEAFGIPRCCEPIIAIGGGVLLDVVGLVASLYRRGVPYLRVPTTLLSLVDASVGAKVGVNFSNHKNRIGAYYPPLITFLDKTFLQTLESRQICNGLAEILKIAIVKNRDLFELLEENGPVLIREKFQDMHASRPVIRYAIQGMLEELAPNLWEQKLERCVDFGHSFSPTIEMKALPELLHGEAVAVDMALSTVLANQRGLLSSRDLSRVFDLMKALKLPIIHAICEPPLLYRALQETTLHRGGLQRLPLPIAIGSVGFFNDVTFEEIETAVFTLKQLV